MITLKNSSFCNYQKKVHTAYNTLLYCKNTVKILWKDTASAKFWVNLPKLYEKCVVPENFYTKKLGKISVFYAIPVIAS